MPKNILIASAQVPFTRGGAEILADTLKKELVTRGFNADIVQLPFNALPKEVIVKQMNLWKNLDLSSFSGHNVDLVIGTKFPSYLINHPRKITWLVHQHRQVYDLYGSRFGDFSKDSKSEALRRLIVEEDLEALKNCNSLYTISENVTERLERYLGLESKPLLPPLPLGERYYQGEPKNYILSVGRLCSIKRVDMIVKAMSQIDDSLVLNIVGLADEPNYDTYLKNEIDKHHLWERVNFLGRVSEEELLKLYSEAFLVYYAPFDEDYGFVTLEGLKSGVPVVTCTDSGGVLSFIKDGENGIITEPNEKSLAEAINKIADNPSLRNQLSENTMTDLNIPSWDEVIEALTSEL